MAGKKTFFMRSRTWVWVIVAVGVGFAIFGGYKKYTKVPPSAKGTGTGAGDYSIMTM